MPFPRHVSGERSGSASSGSVSPIVSVLLLTSGERTVSSLIDLRNESTVWTVPTLSTYVTITRTP